MERVDNVCGSSQSDPFPIIAHLLPRLTGLLSFMLSDEMTTGSVTSTDNDKRAYAVRSHAWNIQQKRFKEAFPDYCTPTIRDLPNMGEKERGSPSTNAPSPIAQSPATQPPTPTIAQPAPLTGSDVADPNALSRPAQSGANGEAAANARGWADAWRQVFWEKWRWGVILALALVVSRMSSR